LWQNIETSAAMACPFPVAATSFGRAQRTQRKVARPAQFAPVKVGRKGDFQPLFFGASRKHAQGVRQCRRLQAFARLCSSDASHAGIQRAESWGAILRATGFSPDFCTWWSTSAFRASGAPGECPMFPPDAGMAWAMFDSVSLAVRDLEKQLMKQSRQYARFRRSQNPNLVFADIKPPATPGVELLLQPCKVLIDDIDSEEGKIVLDREFDFLPDRPIVCNGIKMQVIHHDSDAVWVSNPEDATVGSHLLQTRMVGTLHDLSQEFLAAWRDRWMRHADVPPERWETIISFARQHMPPNRFSWNAMQADDLAQIVQHKKRTTTHGLDGVRLSDLQKMPLQVNRAFCDMFAAAETTGRWPEQVVNGKVVSLAKVPTPGSPSDFRPITIFGLLYRCWSSFHAKKALFALEESLPETLYGSRRGRHAAQLWSKLLWTIEWAYQKQIDIAGVVIDLQKAFNMLPRLAVFEIAAHVGLPGPVMLGWAGALAQMQRFFVLRGSLSPGIASVTGFPEGCGLSCVAMVLVDAAFHQWQSVFFPLCTALSYVDDWQLICNHPSFVHGAQQCLERFVHAMDLVLDGNKSYAWALSTEGRKLLRTQGSRVVLSAKSLGAHVQFSRKHTNSSQMDRILAMGPIWPRLRLSACSYRAKIRALRVAAWPRALHAVNAVTLSDASFHGLRTGAMKGLDAETAGSNAWIHLGLIEHPLTDPLFWAVVQTFRGCRDCGDARMIEPHLIDLANGSADLPANGISATLLTRLQLLGWHVSPDGLLHDLFGKFSLFSTCLAELTFRAQWAWLQVVSQKVSHRPGFANLQFADPGDTRAWLSTLGADDVALFHKCLNGSHISQDGKVHCQEGGTDQCPYCLCSDSRYHRFWECEHFSNLRENVTQHERHVIKGLPEFVSGYGWSMRPHTLFHWYRCLSSIELPPTLPVVKCAGDLHFFTDGSCLNQSTPHCRVAAWAVTCVESASSFQSQVISAGPLPGLLQSSYRAETFAILRALESARNCQGHVYIWTDCNAVVIRLRRLLQGQDLRVNCSHFDLWSQIAEALADIAPGGVSITKVAAHRSSASAASPLEEWCFWHNNVVDQAACQAQFARAPGFWEFYSKHVSSVQACQHISRVIQRTLLSISRAVVREAAEPIGDEREDLCVTPPVPVDAWLPLQRFAVPQAAKRWYGDFMVRSVLSWFWDGAFHSGFPVCWVSQTQLYVDYMMCGGDGPLHLDGWTVSSTQPYIDVLAISFHNRVRWFSKVLRESLRHSNTLCTYKYCRPASTALLLHTGCLAIPWSPTRLQMVDTWLLQMCPGGIRRCSSALQSVPVPARDSRFPAVVLSSA
jgi:ribonuclease HI